jgi:hypothetical protein
MSPHALEAIAQRLGNPPWFWPLVLTVLFGLLVLGSMEGGAA